MKNTRYVELLARTTALFLSIIISFLQITTLTKKILNQRVLRIIKTVIQTEI